MNDIVIEFSLIRLFDTSTVELSKHITQLNEDDRYLRFGYVARNDQIEKYVTESLLRINTRTEGDFWFAVTCSVGIVATIHIAIRDGVAEFAFTTAKDYRGKKLGQLLFARGYQLATEFGITRIYMVCLSRNGAMRHIAKKFGMSVMTFGTDAEASVNISYPVPLSKVAEVKMCFIDKNIIEGKL